MTTTDQRREYCLSQRKPYSIQTSQRAHHRWQISAFRVSAVNRTHPTAVFYRWLTASTLLVLLLLLTATDAVGLQCDVISVTWRHTPKALAAIKRLRSTASEYYQTHVNRASVTEHRTFIGPRPSAAAPTNVIDAHDNTFWLDCQHAHKPSRLCSFCSTLVLKVLLAWVLVQ